MSKQAWICNDCGRPYQTDAEASGCEASHERMHISDRFHDNLRELTDTVYSPDTWEECAALLDDIAAVVEKRGQSVDRAWRTK